MSSIINSSSAFNISKDNISNTLCNLITKSTDSKLISDIITVLLVLINLVTFIGNLLVILSVATVNKLRKISDQYIASLALADLLVSLFVLPFAVIRQNLGYWPFKSIYLCQFYISADIFTCLASILNLCCISVDRYVAISRPLKYITRRSRRNSFLMIAIAWIMPIIVILPPLIGPDKHIVGIGCCYITFNKGYRIYSSLLGYFFPLTVIAYVHLRIFYIIKARSKTLQQYKRNPRNQDCCQWLWEFCLEKCLHYSNVKQCADHLKPSILLGKIRKKDVKSDSSRPTTDDIDSYNRSVTNVQSSTLSYTCKSSEQDHQTNEMHSNSLNKTFSICSLVEMKIYSPEPVDANLKLLPTFQVPTSQYEIHTQPENIDTENHSRKKSNFEAINLGVIKSGERIKHLTYEQHNDCNSKPQVANISKHSSLTINSKVDKKKGKQSRVRFYRYQEKSIFNREKKSVRTVTIVVGCFFLCWTPFFSFYLGEALCDCTFSEELYAVVTWIGYLNSIFNPFIYAFYNKEYANAFVQIIHLKC
uniref:G-protein coupled receptors family 1 profile domain-containing protein n=1 Tax=Trichobilharzia regenti TaxID=157069 RepID=A0AA85J8X3_TRIRE|nr:unnamed protein product [Trichobilharzia regenti]